jgi:hypothetical protein
VAHFPTAGRPALRHGNGLGLQAPPAKAPQRARRSNAAGSRQYPCPGERRAECCKHWPSAAEKVSSGICPRACNKHWRTAPGTRKIAGKRSSRRRAARLLTAGRKPNFADSSAPAFPLMIAEDQEECSPSSRSGFRNAMKMGRTPDGSPTVREGTTFRHGMLALDQVQLGLRGLATGHHGLGL